MGVNDLPVNIKIAFRYLETIEIFLTTYIRPKLKYTAPEWSPHSRGRIDLKEKVQRRVKIKK